MLDRIKTLLGITDETKDSILNILIEDTIADAIMISAIDVYDCKLDSVVTKMVIYNYNRLGQDGITSQSYAGASESYVDGYSAEILRLLRSFRKVKFH